MSQTQWGPIKVHDFFSDYNWTGETSQLDYLETNQDTVEPSSLFCLTIRDFLGRGNWTGKSAQKFAKLSISQNTPLSLTISVNEFFERINWSSYQPIPSAVSVSAAIPSTPSSSESLNVTNLSNLF